MWDDRLPEAALHAEEAVRIAHNAGPQVVLACALNVRASVHLHHDEIEAGIRAADEADQVARRCGDSMQLAAAANWRVMCLHELGMTTKATAVALETFREALTGGTPHWGYFLAALGAEGLLLAGRWHECRALLREALSARTGSIPAAALRMVAARLAVRSGDLAAANQHLDRARELIPGDYPGLRMRMALTGADVLIAHGHPRQAIEWVRTRIIGSQSAQLSVAFPNLRAVRYNDQLLLPLATAAAELATASRDLGDPATAAWAISTLEEAIARWPHKPFTAAPESNIQAMRRALFAAELARCRGDATEATRWTAAIDNCRRAGAPWHAALSCLRCANALTIAGSPRPNVAQLLREAYRAAVELDATPLRRDVEALARINRINLREPTVSSEQTRAAGPLADLTGREREILAYLVAGRSNGEIAKDLVISDKTVSVHVSNILRKTGTSTREEAAALAERLAARDRNHQTK
jgi:DNA-binding CsgD family transcriptional regulator